MTFTLRDNDLLPGVEIEASSAGNQPAVAVWNLSRLAETLLGLLSPGDGEAAEEAAKEIRVERARREVAEADLKKATEAAPPPATESEEPVEELR